MKGILRYLKDYKKESILAPLFKMLEATFELLIPIVMANVIDVGIAGRDISYVVKMCLVMILLGIIGLVCSITAQYFSAKAATGFGTALRNDLFRHITSLSYTEIDNIGTSTLLTRMTSDTNQVQTGVNMVLRLFLRSPFIVFGAMIMSFTIDVGHDICGDHTGTFNCCVRCYGTQHTSVQEGAEQTGQSHTAHP